VIIENERSHMLNTEHRRWISYREAQKAVNLSRGTLWKLVESGCVPAAKVGRRVLIEGDERRLRISTDDRRYAMT
jgi:excisionase family DNA binding protein